MILYTNGCFYSNIIEYKLNQAKLSYEICRNLNIIEEKGFYQLPVLEIGGRQLDFLKANKFLDKKIKLNRRNSYESTKRNKIK